MPFWPPPLDSATPLSASSSERFVLRRMGKQVFLGIDPRDQSITEVRLMDQAHQFLTQEAALRAAGELHRLGHGEVDVVKVEKD